VASVNAMTSLLSRTFVASVLSFTALSAVAQTTAPVAAPTPTPGVIAAHPEWPKANPADVATPQTIIAALSEAISGEASKPRDWARVRSLFIPGAGRMVPVRVPKSGPADLTVLSPEEYEKRASSQTFYEQPIAYDVTSFGRITHVYESYGLKHALADAAPYVRGVNSVELLFDGSRYYILQVLWDTERPDNPLPAKLAK
jgi:hypothetical protein